MEDKENAELAQFENEPTDDPDAWMPEENTQTEAIPAIEKSADTDSKQNSDTTANTGGEAPQESKKLKFTAQIDHADREVELEESEIPTLYQKAVNHDRAQARLTQLEQKLTAAGIETPKRDFRSEMNELVKIYPDALTTGGLPEEVRRAAVGGKNVALAYADYRLRQSEAENKILKQNAKNITSAPVRGSGGGSPAMDEFIKGFDSDF